MNLEQLRATVAMIRAAIEPGKKSWSNLEMLVWQVEQRIDGKNPLNLPITQEQVDTILQIYTPLYQNALTGIEIAADTLGTDPFH